MTVFFTADQHFGDLNWGYGVKKQTGKQSDREAKLVINWNKVVGKEDTVYVLGDFAESVEDFLTFHELVNGTKIYLLGNHDPKMLHNKGACEWLFPNVEFLHGEGHRVKVGVETFFVSHRPFASWPWDTIHIHGHTHDGKSQHWNEDYRKVDGRADVGVDAWDLAPVDADTLVAQESPWPKYVVGKGLTYHWGALDDPFGLDEVHWLDGSGYTSRGYDLSGDLDWNPDEDRRVPKKKKGKKRKQTAKEKRWYYW
jgi:calcineurin-like phosphoesterase family protein